MYTRVCVCVSAVEGWFYECLLNYIVSRGEFCLLPGEIRDAKNYIGARARARGWLGRAEIQSLPGDAEWESLLANSMIQRFSMYSIGIRDFT